MDKLNQKALEILEKKIDDLEDEVRILKYENEDLQRKLSENNIEKLEEKDKILSKMKTSISTFKSFFDAFEKAYGKLEAVEYIKGSDPVRDLIEEIIRERVKNENQTKKKD